MNKLSLVTILIVTSLTNAYALNCDVSKFQSSCVMPVKHKPVKGTMSLVYCGNTNVYVNQQQYLTLMRYQRSNINMVLKVNGEFVESPCIPAEFK